MLINHEDRVNFNGPKYSQLLAELQEMVESRHDIDNEIEVRATRLMTSIQNSLNVLSRFAALARTYSDSITPSEMFLYTNLPNREALLEHAVDRLHNTSVVYILWQDKKVLYVGQSRTGLSRIKAHRHRGWDQLTVLRVPTIWLDDIERFYIRSLMPIQNVTHNTDASSRTPDLEHCIGPVPSIP